MGTERPSRTVNSTVVVVSDGRSALVLMQPAELALEQVFEFLGGSGVGLVERGSVVSHRNRLLPIGPGFHHTAHVGAAALTAVLIAEADLRPAEMVAESSQRSLDFSLHLTGECFPTLDVFVRIDLYLHALPLAAGL